MSWLSGISRGPAPLPLPQGKERKSKKARKQESKKARKQESKKARIKARKQARKKARKKERKKERKSRVSGEQRSSRSRYRGMHMHNATRKFSHACVLFRCAHHIVHGESTNHRKLRTRRQSCLPASTPNVAGNKRAHHEKRSKSVAGQQVCEYNSKATNKQRLAATRATPFAVQLSHRHPKTTTAHTHTHTHTHMHTCTHFDGAISRSGDKVTKASVKHGSNQRPFVCDNLIFSLRPDTHTHKEMQDAKRKHEAWQTELRDKLHRETHEHTPRLNVDRKDLLSRNHER